MAEINIHASLTRFTNNQDRISLPINTIGEIIPYLCRQFPTLSASLINDNGIVSPYINFYIDGKHLSTYAHKTKLLDNTKIDIITALVGG